MASASRWAAACFVAASALAASACGGEATSLVPEGPPVGSPVLPDLVPEPPDVLQMMRDEQGRWSIRFTSVLVNVGEGDFALKGTRAGGGWDVEQVLTYSESGAELVPVDPTMAWGGDGHEHWHVARVASYRLEPAVEESGAALGPEGREDAKIGFCFYDFGQELDRGPGEARFEREGCGKEDSESFLMGLSPGWGDKYIFSLPGQSIDVSDVPDGAYRLWAQADEKGWFREATRDNNLTWVDFDLATRSDDLRTATVTSVGPAPE